MNGLARGSEPPASDLTHLAVTDLYRCGANSEHNLGRASPCVTGLSASLKPRLAPGFPLRAPSLTRRSRVRSTFVPRGVR